MKKKGYLTALALMAGAAQAGHAVHWGYQGEEGPATWGQLSPDYATCASGRNQSPVDLKGFIEAELPPLALEYRKDANEVVNNGHTIQVNYLPGSLLKVNGREFELKQFHFHVPSENRIEGRSYPMEMHLVHADKDGNLAVVAVMITQGGENTTMEKIWAQMPEQAGEKRALEERISAAGLLPASADYYRFNGSLTTPPCTEGVRWYVMKQPLTVSAGQVEKFRHIMHHPNNRPVQPVYARPLLK
jgi:carbonic anhydrase